MVEPRASKSFGEEFGNQSAPLEGVTLLQESERGTLAWTWWKIHHNLVRPAGTASSSSYNRSGIEVSHMRMWHAGLWSRDHLFAWF